MKAVLLLFKMMIMLMMTLNGTPVDDQIRKEDELFVHLMISQLYI